MKEYTVKEVADLVGKHEETVSDGFVQVSCRTHTETVIKKVGEFLNRILIVFDPSKRATPIVKT